MKAQQEEMTKRYLKRQELQEGLNYQVEIKKILPSNIVFKASCPSLFARDETPEELAHKRGEVSAFQQQLEMAEKKKVIADIEHKKENQSYLKQLNLSQKL